jgi:sirohydrochlorin cobaltochelatase
MTMPTPTGLLLFAHGARDPNWALPFEAVARHCRAARGEGGDGPSTVALAFLEFMTPDLVTAGRALVAAGCGSVVVVPLFLGAGGHVRKDIPRLLDELRSAHPAVKFMLQPAVGESPRLAQAMAEIALQAGADPGAQP